MAMGETAGEFSSDVIVDDGQVVVRVQGEVDIGSSDQFGAVLAEALSSGRRIVLDLSRTTFIDSYGVATLLHAYRKYGQPPEAIVVSGAPPMVRKVLRITGIDQILVIQDRPDPGDDGGPSRPDVMRR